MEPAEDLTASPPAEDSDGSTLDGQEAPPLEGVEPATEGEALESAAWTEAASDEAPEGSPAAEEDAALPSEASGYDEAPPEPEPERPSHSRMSLRATSQVPSPEPSIVPALGGKLAQAVETLQGLEDELTTTLRNAEKALRGVGANQVYRDAGFETARQLEDRLLRATHTLFALREAQGPLPAPPPVIVRPRHRSRQRAPQALGVIARTTKRLKLMDDRALRSCVAVRKALREIDARAAYLECGYTSYEDFLERALGPSPMLARALALAESQPEEPEPPPEPEAEPEALEADRELTQEEGMLASFAEPATEEAPGADAAPDPAEPEAPEAPPPRPVRPPRKAMSKGARIAVSVVLALTAAGGGAWGAKVVKAHEPVPAWTGPDASVGEDEEEDEPGDPAEPAAERTSRENVGPAEPADKQDKAEPTEGAPTRDKSAPAEAERRSGERRGAPQAEKPAKARLTPNVAPREPPETREK